MSDGLWVDVSVMGSLYEEEMDMHSYPSRFRYRHRHALLGSSEGQWKMGNRPDYVKPKPRTPDLPKARQYDL